MSYDDKQEFNPEKQAAKKGPVLSKQEKSSLYLVLLGILCTFLSVLGLRIWLIIVIIKVLYVHFKNKSDSQPEESAQRCNLCDITADNLVPVVTTIHGKNETIHVCEECYHVNVFRKPDEHEKETPPEETETKHLLHETPAGRDERIALLAKRRNSGKPLQEDLFLEDIEDARSIRKILNIWSSYEFEEDYPEIDAVLAQLKAKENRGKIYPADITKLKAELVSLFHGEDLFAVPEESGTLPECPEKSVSQEKTGTYAHAQPEQSLESVPLVPKKLPDGLLYCRRCQRLYSGSVCIDCGKGDGRIPEPDDLCFLIDLYELQSNTLDDALRQKCIPFLKDQISGVGDVFREQPPMRGIFRFYTLFSHFAEALSVLDCLPISSEPYEEE